MNIEELIWDMSARCYDDLEEEQRIRENLEIAVMGGGSRVRVSLRDTKLFDEVLILVSRDRYACGNDSDHIARAAKLNWRQPEATLVLDGQYKYLTATVDKVYAPIVIGGNE
ncbi:MAG: hypothetical protein E7366_00855 [Clostridiales bacterium]|jgi:hypothetical protein|nr:hypothetical protein [Clostridiales bacterium]